MQILKVSVSLPDGSRQPDGRSTHADIELRLSANDPDCDVVIALPLHPRSEPVTVATAQADVRSAAADADDDYVLGGYAGI